MEYVLAVPPGGYFCRALAYTVAALVSRICGKALAPSCNFLVRTSCWLRNGLAVWLVVRSTRSIELISVSYWRSLYSTNPSVGGATHALPLGLHPDESILARRQALPLAVPDASTPSAWNGRIHPLQPTGFYGGPRPPPGVAGISAVFPLLFLTLSLARSACPGAATTVWHPAS